MTAWAAWYDYILPELPGIAPNLVDFELRRMAIEFCRETQLHSIEVTPIDVVANTAEYTLTSPVTGTEVSMVKAAWFSGMPLDLAPIDALSAKNPHWPDDTSTQPFCFTQRQPDKLILYPKPSVSVIGALRVEVTLVPTLAAPGLTDWIANKYMYDLACGTKGKLQAQPGKPWTNLESSVYNLACFELAKSNARIDTTRSLMRSALQVRMRPAA